MRWKKKKTFLILPVYYEENICHTRAEVEKYLYLYMNIFFLAFG